MAQTFKASIAASITLAIGVTQLAFADDSNFSVSVKSSSEHTNPSNACDDAFYQAEQEAIKQLDEHFNALEPVPFYLPKLISQQETRTLQDTNLTVCEFSGTWQGTETDSVLSLIGTEIYIDGEYTGSCLDERNGDICWQRIVHQASNDIYQTLEQQYGQLESIALRYGDFEGRQREQYRQKRLEMIADGRFYFDIVDANQLPDTTRISVQRKDEPVVISQAEPQTEQADWSEEQPASRSVNRGPDIDVTIFYAWDGNDTAWQDDLAISSNRWGAGIWANERLGFAVFKGEDKIGLADNEQTVQNSSGRYDTFGVGMGFRMFKHGPVTVENMFYYVDAQPYTATIAPSNCTGCTPRAFESQDYLQATTNIKTNSKGVNVGWMFTWKLLELQRDVDHLSSGIYLEALF